MNYMIVVSVVVAALTLGAVFKSSSAGASPVVRAAPSPRPPARVQYFDNQAWRDWQRVEDCVLFGIRRYVLLALVLLVINEYMRPVSELLASVCVCVAAWTHFRFARRDDERRAASAQLSPSS